MYFPIQNVPPDTTPTNSLVVQVLARDVIWDRPIFKAPPLEVYPKLFNSATLAEDLRLIGLGER